MSFDQKRKSYRIQIPEGREQATLLIGKQAVEVRIVDESAGGFAVAMTGDADVEQNQIYALKTAAGLFEIRVARIEEFSDGKLLGLMRLTDLSSVVEEAPQAASWCDYLFSPRQSMGSGNFVAVGIGGTLLIGMLFCVLALYGIKYYRVKHTSASPLLHDFTEAMTEEVLKAKAAAEEAERLAAPQKDQVIASSPTSAAASLSSTISSDTLYRLNLTADQSRRVREILIRVQDQTQAEAEIAAVLTAEQIQRWKSLSQ